jgi:transcriptional regulator with XRE-family HTH domain
MTEISTSDMALIISRLYGPNLKKTVSAKNVSLYRLAKDTGISYRTLQMWRSEKARPSPSFAIRVAKYLGLISPNVEEMIELKNQIGALTEKLDRLSASSRSERKQ